MKKTMMKDTTMKETKRKIFISLFSMSLFSVFSLSPVFAESMEVKTIITDAEAKQAETSHHWAYSGNEAPENWGDLSENYIMCKTGKNQSPVDINKEILRDAKLPAIPFDYNMLVPSTIVNNGHTVQVNMWSGGEIMLDGIKFTLKQFHFHTPSENKINGQSFPLEAHFVHLSEDNKIAVVAILFAPGADDKALTNLWKKLPMNKGEEAKLEPHSLRPLEMERKLSNYYRFNGSLTTPPCTEGVRWIVMKRPFHVSKKQVEKLQKALKQPNNRPVQPINARVVVE